VAAALARAWKLPLQLVHVVDLFAIDSLPPDATQQYLETRERDLEALGAELREQTGATVQTEVRRGLADYELVEYSAACDARLLVVAALGARQAPRWLVGSVSERIARTTRVPALIVRDAQPLMGPQPASRALAAIEHDATSHAALRWVTQLGRNYALDLLIARVVSPVAEQARLGLESTSPAGTLDPALEKRLREDFATWAADLPEAAAAKLVFAPAWGDVDARVGTPRASRAHAPSWSAATAMRTPASSVARWPAAVHRIFYQRVRDPHGVKPRGRRAARLPHRARADGFLRFAPRASRRR
jgi:nucleotide-binding universal stress UspA family protein